MPFMRTIDEFLKKAEDKRVENFPVKKFLDDLGQNGVKLIQDWSEGLAVIDKIIDSLDARGYKKKILDSEVFFDSLLKIANTQAVHAQFLALELLNKIASNTDQRVVLRRKFQEKIGNIAKGLAKKGDYEHQILILEFLIRYQAREDRETVRKWFGDNLGLKFCQISKKTFESDARPFLNAVNENNPNIVSLPCHRAVVGAREIQPPPAKGYQSLWVDFQYGSKAIRIYCKLHPSVGQETSKWDSLVIEASDIVSYCVEEGEARYLHKITVARECYVMFDATMLSQFPGREVKLEFEKDLPVRQSIETLCCHLSVTTNSSQTSGDVFEGSQKSVSSVALNQFKISLLKRTPKGLRKNLPASYLREEREKSVGRHSTLTITNSTFSKRTSSSKKIVEKENLDPSMGKSRAETKEKPKEIKSVFFTPEKVGGNMSGDSNDSILRQDGGDVIINLDDIIGNLEDDVVEATVEAEKEKENLPPAKKSKKGSKTKVPPKSILKGKRVGNAPIWKNNYSFRKPATSTQKVSKTKKKEETEMESEKRDIFDQLSSSGSSIGSFTTFKVTKKVEKNSSVSKNNTKKTYRKPVYSVAQKSGPSGSPMEVENQVTKTPKIPKQFDQLSSSGSSIGSFTTFKVTKKVEKNSSVSKNNAKKTYRKPVYSVAQKSGPSGSPMEAENQVTETPKIPKQFDQKSEKVGGNMSGDSNDSILRQDGGDVIINVDDIIGNLEDDVVQATVEAEKEKENFPPAKKFKKGSKTKVPPKSTSRGSGSSEASERLLDFQVENQITETPKTRTHRSPLRSITKQSQKSPRINLPNELNVVDFFEAMGVQVNLAPKRNRIRMLFQELKLKVDETLLKIEQELDA